MKLYIPVATVRTENLDTNKSFELSTDSKEELKSDDMIVLDDKALLNAIQEEMDNDGVDGVFVNKLLKLLEENEDFHSIIIRRGLDLATKCTEDPEKALFVAAKKMWATIDIY